MYDSLKRIPDEPSLRDLVISEILLPMQDMAPIPVITALFKVLIKNYQGSQKAQLLSSSLNKFPVLLIFHGGGWLIRDKSIMDQMAQYIASNSEIIVCNINYRLLSDLNNTVKMNEIVEDVFGSLLWVKNNIHLYKGDSTQVAVTGDSAGGHLASMIVNSGGSTGI